jgi:hypothetical protein
MAAYPTMHEVRAAADEYWDVWQQLLSAAPKLRSAIGQHTPMALGWKVEGDLAPLEAAMRVYELGDSLYAGPVNGERAILTIHKLQAVALDTLQDVKILQRRPSKPEDTLGPDSLDFNVPHGLPNFDELEKAAEGHEATIEAQHNENHAWLSIKYKNHEYKLQDHQLWEVCIREGAAILDLELS